jgi:hypothetical protein
MKTKGNEIFAWFRDQRRRIDGPANLRFASTPAQDDQSSDRRPGLMEVLTSQSFPADPKRAAVTRCIVQPDTDAFEEAESAGSGESGITKSGIKRPASHQSNELQAA